MRNTVSFLNRVFGHDKIKSISAEVDTALNGRSLDVDTMVVDLTTGPAHLDFWSHEPLPFFTRDRKRFVTTEQTALGAWTRSNPLVLSRGGSQLSISYPQTVTRVGALDYSVNCTSVLGKLTQLSHKGGIYDAVSQTKAGPLLREICGYVNGSPAAGVTIYVAPEFENIILYGWLPYLSPTGENGAKTGSARDNLLQVLFAINAALRDDENGVIRVENLSTAASSAITADRIYRDGAQVVQEQPVTAVTVLEHTFLVGTDEKVLFDGTTSSGQIIVFSGPVANLTATGFSITESGANYAVLSAGTGLLTGTPYVDTTREITRNVSSSDTPNTERIESATLVSITNSSDVADKLAEYYSHRMWVECDAQIEFEDAGDVINIWDPFDKVLRSACIERISGLSVSNVMKGRISALVGYTPWQTVPFTDKRVLLTGSGTWTVPAGVTSVTVVLIGAGSGGKRGTNGAAGTAYGASGNIPPVGNPISAPAGKGGAGGIGGAGGASGKIFRLEITVSPGQTVAFACGIKGTGGASPTAGTETVFGSYTSASGSQSETGYTDPVTGARYAIPGTNGVDGGAGGDGGNASQGSASAGGNGKNAGTKTGGSGTNGMTGGWSNMWTMSYGGHGGGGASGQNNGGNAVAQSGTSGQGDGHGGNGASSTTPLWSNTDYGCGGNGGNGGGGGGGCGGGYYLQSRYSGDPFTWSYYPTAGSAGTGGAGGDGVNGCVILYYREPA